MLKEILLGGYLIFGSFPQKGDVFNAVVNKKDYKVHYTIDVNGDNNADAVISFYDLDKDGRPETAAMYKIMSHDNVNIQTEQNARGVFFDMDGDGIFENGLLDQDADGTLETEVKKAGMEYKPINPTNDFKFI